jgi:hypothetical protein
MRTPDDEEPTATGRGPPARGRGARLLASLGVLLCVAPVAGCGGEEAPPPVVSPATAEPAPAAERTRSQFVAARDRFPSATEPGVVPASAAGWLEPEEEVYGVVLGGRARAYPLTMLAFHHVVNDVVGGVPVLVTYCVVCSSGATYDPVVRGERLLFGVEGAWQGTATMYDRSSGSVWLHLTGECVSGPFAGRVLRRVPTGRNTTWEEWLATHPDTEVMAREERWLRPADGLGYFSRAGAQSGIDHFPPEMRDTLEWRDARLPRAALVYGLVADGAARAWPFERLGHTRVVHERVGQTDVTLWFHGPSRSAAAFDRRADGRLLSFEVGPGDTFLDSGTGSRWNLEGSCVQGPLRGTQLVPLEGLRAEWYGWYAAHRDTTLWAPE